MGLSQVGKLRAADTVPPGLWSLLSPCGTLMQLLCSKQTFKIQKSFLKPSPPKKKILSLIICRSHRYKFPKFSSTKEWRPLVSILGVGGAF